MLSGATWRTTRLGGTVIPFGKTGPLQKERLLRCGQNFEAGSHFLAKVPPYSSVSISNTSRVTFHSRKAFGSSS